MKISLFNTVPNPGCEITVSYHTMTLDISSFLAAGTRPTSLRNCSLLKSCPSTGKWPPSEWGFLVVILGVRNASSRAGLVLTASAKPWGHLHQSLGSQRQSTGLTFPIRAADNYLQSWLFSFTGSHGGNSFCGEQRKPWVKSQRDVFRWSEQAMRTS